MRLSAVFMLTFFTGQAGYVNADNQPQELIDDTAKLNYSVGYQIGSDFKYQDIQVRSKAIIQGIEDAISGGDALMSKQEMQQTMADLGKKVTELKQKQRQQISKDYAEQNRQFLLENAKRKGIITTKSGLQYRVIEQGGGGGGIHPGPDDKVYVNYSGRLINGTEFDSSRKSGKPVTFQVNQVIKGWSEALQLMRRGDHWLLFIPAELAYGEKGAGTAIPPDSTLIFDVELISIQK